MVKESGIIRCNNDVHHSFPTAEMINGYDFAFLHKMDDPGCKLTVSAFYTTAINQKVNNADQLIT